MRVKKRDSDVVKSRNEKEEEAKGEKPNKKINQGGEITERKTPSTTHPNRSHRAYPLRPNLTISNGPTLLLPTTSSTSSLSEGKSHSFPNLFILTYFSLLKTFFDLEHHLEVERKQIRKKIYKRISKQISKQASKHILSYPVLVNTEVTLMYNTSEYTT